MIRIAAIEFTKYVRSFVVIIIIYVLVMTLLESRVEAKNFFQYGTFDFQTFKVVNSSFATLLTSAIPFTIILNICNEFKNGYALKLISNGLSRRTYYSYKLTLGGVLAILVALLYLLIVCFLVTLQQTTYFDAEIFITSLFQAIVCSMFFSSIAVSLALLLRTWQYTLLAYYGYATVESVVVALLQESSPWVKYLPFYLTGSIFRLSAVPEKFTDYLLAAAIIIPFWLVIVWCGYHFFKKADL
jgi:hypothetical protein